MKLLKKIYDNFGGVSLHSPELLRKQSVATDATNVIQTDNLSLTKRKGYEIHLKGQGGSGSVTFNEVDIASGIQTNSRLVTDENMWKELSINIDVTYTGTKSSGIQMTLDPTDNLFYVLFFEDGDEIARFNCRTGKGISDPSISDLVAFINSLSNFAAVDNGTGNPRAAFVLSTSYEQLPYSLEYKEYVQIPMPIGVTGPFAAHYATRNSDGFENNSFAQTNDVLYITNGLDGLYKYDGLRLYKAGLPVPNALAEASQAGGLNGDYVYRVMYRYTDNKDNIIFSDVSPELTVTHNNTQSELTIPTIQSGSGYDTDGNMEIVIVRTQSSGNLLFIVDTIPNDPNIANVTYLDTKLDTDINDPFTLPVNEPGIPPVCRYVDVFRNQLILTGDSQNVNTVYFSDIQFPEGFSINNQFDTSSRSGGPNSGVKSLDNYLFVFKPNSISVVTGDLNTLQFQVDTLTDEGVGCLAHATLIEVDKKIWFLSRKGIYSLDRNGIQEMSTPLKGIFDNTSYESGRSTAFHWIDERAMLFSLPVFIETAGEKHLDMGESKILYMDLETGAWYFWKNIDMTGGMNNDIDKIWFSGKYVDSNDAISQSNNEFLALNSSQDYADHEQAIVWEFKSHWETLQEPNLFKKFNRVSIFSIDDVLADFVPATPFVLQLETNRNYVNDIDSKTEVSFSGGSAGWGEFAWGETPWGDLNLSAKKTRLRANQSRSLRLVLRNSVTHENVLISGYEYEIYAPQRSALKDNM